MCPLDYSVQVKSGLILGIGELLAILPVSCWECAVKQLPSMAPPQGYGSANDLILGGHDGDGIAPASRQSSFRHAKAELLVQC